MSLVYHRSWGKKVRRRTPCPQNVRLRVSCGQTDARSEDDNKTKTKINTEHETETNTYWKRKRKRKQKWRRKQKRKNKDEKTNESGSKVENEAKETEKSKPGLETPLWFSNRSTVTRKCSNRSLLNVTYTVLLTDILSTYVKASPASGLPCFYGDETNLRGHDYIRQYVMSLLVNHWSHVVGRWSLVFGGWLLVVGHLSWSTINNILLYLTSDVGSDRLTVSFLPLALPLPPPQTPPLGRDCLISTMFSSPVLCPSLFLFVAVWCCCLLLLVAVVFFVLVCWLYAVVFQLATLAVGVLVPWRVQARGNGAPVTAEDLALREDICYQIFGDVGSLVRGELA